MKKGRILSADTNKQIKKFNKYEKISYLFGLKS